MPRRIWIAVAAGLVLLALAAQGGKYYMLRSVAGTPCAPVTLAEIQAAGLSFHHNGDTSTRLVNGTAIHAAEGHPPRDCSWLQSAFRCTQQGPAVVQFNAFNRKTYYDVPDGSIAVLYGTAEGATCTVVADR